MSKKSLETACLEPSHHWTQAGSGSVGKIHLEILKCDKLPNMDKVMNISVKDFVSDPYVSVVYEDSIFRTSTITNCLSPRWMPWTK